MSDISEIDLDRKIGKKVDISSNTDAVQRSMGSAGKFQVILCLLIFLTKFPMAFHQMAIIFLAPPATFICADTNDTSCPCDEPIYDRTIFTNTIVTQWDLICERRWYKDLNQTFAQLGTLVGSIIFGIFSDRFGRKKPLVAAVVLEFAAGVSAALVNNFWLFCFFRFLIGMSVGGTIIGFVICMEFIGSENRATVSALYQLPFNFGHLLLPVFGFFFRDWSHFQLVISAPVVILVSYYWLMPESPRWLLAVNKTEEAIVIMEKAATMNKRSLTHIRQDIENYQIAKEKEKLKKGTVMDLFRTPNIRRNIIGMSINWLVAAFCFYGISQYVGQLSGDIFVNVAASAAVTIPGTLLSIPLMKLMGRKTLVIFSNLTCSICLLIISILPEDAAAIQVTLACVGASSSFIAFILVYLYCSELFPTVVRNVAVGICSMMARVGSMMAPFVAGLSTQGQWLPPLLFGVLPIVGALFCWHLPETKGSELMTSLEEGEHFGRKNREVLTVGFDNLGVDIKL